MLAGVGVVEHRDDHGRVQICALVTERIDAAIRNPFRELARVHPLL